MVLSEGGIYYSKEKGIESVSREAIRQLFTLLPVLFLTLAVSFSFTVSVTFTLTALFIGGTGGILFFLMPRPFGPLICALFVAPCSLIVINLFFYSGESVFSAGWLLSFFQEISFDLYSFVNPEFVSGIRSPSTCAFLVLLVAVAGWFAFYYRFYRGRGMIYLFFGSVLILLMLFAGNPVGLVFVLFLISVLLGMPLEKAPDQKFDSVIINERGREKFWNIRIGTGLLAIFILLIVAAVLLLLWLPPSSVWWPAVVDATDQGITIFYANDFAVQLDKNPSGVWLWIAGEIILLLLLIVTVMTYRNRLRPVHLGIVLLIAFGVFILRGFYSVDYLAELPVNLPLLFLRSAVFMFLIVLFFIWRPNLVPLAILFFFFLPVLVSPAVPDDGAFRRLEDMIERIGKDDAFSELFDTVDDTGIEEEKGMEDEPEMEEWTEEAMIEDEEEDIPGFSLPSVDPGMDDSDLSMDQDQDQGQVEDEILIDPRIIEGLLKSFFPQGDKDISVYPDELTMHDDRGEAGLMVEQRDEDGTDDKPEHPEGLITGGSGENGRSGEDTKTPGFISSFLSEHLSGILNIIAFVVSVLAVWLFYPYFKRMLKRVGPLLVSISGYFKELWKAICQSLYNAMPDSFKDYFETLNANPDRREYYRQLRIFSRRYPRQKSETPREYCNRLFIISAREEEKKLKKKEIEDFRRLTHHFEEVRYR